MYINRKDALEILKRLSREPYYQHDGEDYYVGVAEATGEIYSMPSAEVKEVIHAKWEWFDTWDGDDTFGDWKMLRCSNCLGSEGARENAKFCSECGAIMDA